MVDRHGVFTLIDLGLSRPVRLDRDHRPVPIRTLTPYGKAAYLSPEMASLQPIDPFALDIWSLGILLHVLLTGRPLYASPTDPAFDHLCQGRLGAVLEHHQACHPASPALPPLARDLLASMLQPDPCQRVTLEGVRAHPWVRGVGGVG